MCESKYTNIVIPNCRRRSPVNACSFGIICGFAAAVAGLVRLQPRAHRKSLPPSQSARMAEALT
jgi:hypothetical protein